MSTRPSYFLVLVLCLAVPILGSKQNQMSSTELNQCLEKSNDLNTGCEFIQCFHKRYHCNDESVTAWAYNICVQFPKEVVLEFTPDGIEMMINIHNCTQNFLVRTFQQRKRLNCHAFEPKYFTNLGKCYAKERNFCQVFRDNRAIFMRQATTLMMKKPRALQAFAYAAKNCTRLNPE